MNPFSFQAVLDDLDVAIHRYKKLWWWQRWLNLYEYQCARHMLALAYKAGSEELKKGYMSYDDFNKLYPAVHEAAKLLGERT